MNYPSPADGGLHSDYNSDDEFVDASVTDEGGYSYNEASSLRYIARRSLVSDANSTGKACWTTASSGNSAVELKDGELAPEEVRWFHKSENDKRWIEFSGYDSLRIEQTYRQSFYERQARLLQVLDNKNSSEGDDVSSVPNGVGKNCSKFNDGSPKDSLPSASLENPLEIRTSEIPKRIGVRGGMYEVDLESWKCGSIYWPGEECPIMRGTWFYDGTWQPLETPYCNTLEAEHLNLFYGDKLLDSSSDDPSRGSKSGALHTKSFPEFHVEWHTSREVYLYSEATSSKLVRSVTQKLGFQKTTGYRLYRGYKVPASLTDRPVDVTHLVFVIHGIGQKMDTGNIIRNTTAFRECVSWLKQKYFPSSSNLRIEFFPVEWRSSLKLDGDIVEAITPHKILGLRQILNESAMDVMYYTSPLYGAEVRKGLLDELNRLYSMFSRHNENFEKNNGKVSVLAHSLGCVILYDIVTGWPQLDDIIEPSRPPSALSPVEEINSSKEAGSPAEKNSPQFGKSSLLFEIDNFFCLGSPLAVFLALRWKYPRDSSCQPEIIPPSLCHRLFNIYHPSDPVAYRMEPLLIRGYERIAPLQIQPYNAAVKVPYSKVPLEPLILLDPRLAKKEGDSECSSNEGTAPNTPIKDRSRGIWNLVRGGLRGDSECGSPRNAGHDSSPPTPGLEHRIDYILREGNLGATYLSALTSHTAYWSNYDTAYFILTHLIPELKAEHSPQESAGIADVENSP
ncbi:phospholipase DDHD1-like [Ischnura elegans]|uniref:phospholipase DDHD1-like n=1 Tax=Ischnura elegans TaxID=197161 RepID=UPI001ED8875F|nr:phospholipase DDHD1-like [Ischnura elegans]XP_046382399.1 phospholipase DDHD1-like [Ischnura elegans]XP_046382400.1 phospholipase DDHD1-like [Ischnura elegans]